MAGYSINALHVDSNGTDDAQGDERAEVYSQQPLAKFGLNASATRLYKADKRGAWFTSR